MDNEELNNASLDIRNAIDIIEWYEEDEDMVKLKELLEEAEHMLDTMIMNRS